MNVILPSLESLAAAIFVAFIIGIFGGAIVIAGVQWIIQKIRGKK